MRYRVGRSYWFALVSGGRELALYLGKNRQGMYRFQVGGGQVWTGYVPPVMGPE